MDDNKKIPRDDISSNSTQTEESYGKLVFSGVEPPTTRNVEDLFED